MHRPSLRFSPSHLVNRRSICRSTKFTKPAGLARIIHDAWASPWRKLVSFGFCSRFVVSAGHPRRETDEFAKQPSASGESIQRANLTPVVVNNSGLVAFDRDEFSARTRCKVLINIERDVFVNEMSRTVSKHNVDATRVVAAEVFKVAVVI